MILVEQDHIHSEGECPICGVKFPHFHRKGSKPKDFEPLEEDIKRTQEALENIPPTRNIDFMTETKKKRKIQAVIDLLKNETNECEDYCVGCFQCQVNRIVEDLESLKAVWYEDN